MTNHPNRKRLSSTKEHRADMADAGVIHHDGGYSVVRNGIKFVVVCQGSIIDTFPTLGAAKDRINWINNHA